MSERAGPLVCCGAQHQQTNFDSRTESIRSSILRRLPGRPDSHCWALCRSQGKRQRGNRRRPLPIPAGRSHLSLSLSFSLSLSLSYPRLHKGRTWHNHNWSPEKLGEFRPSDPNSLTKRAVRLHHDVPRRLIGAPIRKTSAESSIGHSHRVFL